MRCELYGEHIANDIVITVRNCCTCARDHTCLKEKAFLNFSVPSGPWNLSSQIYLACWQNRRQGTSLSSLALISIDKWLVLLLHWRTLCGMLHISSLIIALRHTELLPFFWWTLSHNRYPSYLRRYVCSSALDSLWTSDIILDLMAWIAITEPWLHTWFSIVPIIGLNGIYSYKA